MTPARSWNNLSGHYWSADPINPAVASASDPPIQIAVAAFLSQLSYPAPPVKMVALFWGESGVSLFEREPLSEHCACFSLFAACVDL